MVIHPFWITEQLAIVPRPHGGAWLDHEMSALHTAGINIVISLLELYEENGLGLDHEEAMVRHAGMEFIRFPIRDRGVPEVASFEQFLSCLERHIAAGRRIGVHCRGCIGRSAVVAASLLIRSGVPNSTAWRQVEDARGYPVPDTLEQLTWVDRHIRPLM